jgi:hypothetical protein
MSQVLLPLILIDRTPWQALYEDDFRACAAIAFSGQALE